MTKEDFHSMLECALQKMHSDNALLIELKLKEECINAAFCVVLRQVFNSHSCCVELDFDIEYDKHLQDKKSMANLDSVRPDIVVHKRGSNECNFLFVEAKKSYLKPRDRSKLLASTCDPYCYRFAVGLEYHPGKNYYRYCVFEGPSSNGSEFVWLKHEKA